MSVTGDGGAVIAHAGSIGLRMLAENTGLTGALSTAMARRSFIPSVHDRGQVLTDVAVLLADGGEAISDIDVLRHQRQILGPVASAPTVWRALDEVTDARRRQIQAARARVRRHVWSQLTATGGVPASKVAGTDLGETIVLDVDATIVVTHSEKELAAPTFKRTFGYHPIGVWCDNTGEFLAAALRTGRAGSNTAADHIQVLGEAITQVPMPYRRNLLIRCDGAGASQQLLDWLHAQGQVRGRSLDYSVGFTIGHALSLKPTDRVIAGCRRRRVATATRISLGTAQGWHEASPAPPVDRQPTQGSPTGGARRVGMSPRGAGGQLRRLGTAPRQHRPAHRSTPASDLQPPSDRQRAERTDRTQLDFSSTGREGHSPRIAHHVHTPRAH